MILVAILTAVLRYARIRATCPRLGARTIPYRSRARVRRAAPVRGVVTRRAKRSVAVVHAQEAPVGTAVRVMASSALKLLGLVKPDLIGQDARIDKLSLLGRQSGIVNEGDGMII